MGEVAWLRGEEMDGTEEEGIFAAGVRAYVGIKGKVLAYLKRGFPIVEPA